MNRFIFCLFFMGIQSSFGMDAPSGSTFCAAKNPPAVISESEQPSLQNSSFVQLVPDVAHETLKKYVYTAPGLGAAQLYAVGSNIRNLRLVSKADKSWIDDFDHMDTMIKSLARTYTNNNTVQVVLALGTKPAFEWLFKKRASLANDLTKEVVTQLLVGQIPVARTLMAVARSQKFETKNAKDYLLYNLAGVDGNTLLNAAAKAGDRTIFDAVLARSFEQIDSPNGNGITPVFHAIDNGHTNIALMLFECGASPLIMDDQEVKDSALLHAAEKNNTQVIQYLLLNFPSVRERVNFRPTFLAHKECILPITSAARNNNYEAFKLLFAVPGVTVKPEVIYWAVARNQNMLTDLLAREDIDFNQKSPNDDCEMGYPSFGLVAQSPKGQPLLDDITARDRLSLIARRIHVNAQQEESGKTLLIRATAQAKAKTIQKLLELGALVHVVDSDGKTALDYAQELTTHNKDLIIKMLQEAARAQK